MKIIYFDPYETETQNNQGTTIEILPKFVITGDFQGPTLLLKIYYELPILILNIEDSGFGGGGYSEDRQG